MDINPLKYTFGYATGFIFLLGIIIYLYMLITDHLDDPNQHSTEEKVWMYLFLAILIIGFGISYYVVTCTIYCTNDNVFNGAGNSFGHRFRFGKVGNLSQPSWRRDLDRALPIIPD